MPEFDFQYAGQTNERGEPHGQGYSLMGQAGQIGPIIDFYEGEFKDGKRHGRGTYHYRANNDWKGDRYEGEWEDDKKHGQGTYYHSNRDRYEGEWEDDVSHGQGTIFFANGNRYEGGFKDGVRHGQGTVYETNGNRYEGEWKDGENPGQGAVFFADGTHYEGEFGDGLMKHGQGTLYMDGGDRYEGGWKDGNMHGQGAYYFADGSHYEGLWRNDEMIGEPQIQVRAKPRSEEGNLDPELLARVTGRNVEDIIADLEDDGLLNFSAGSDTAHQGEGMIDSRRFTRIRKLRAEGGMAEVYLAKDKKTGEQVIWKQAAPSRTLSAMEANRALANEVEILSGLGHPRIPHYVDSGFIVNEEGDRVLVLIMEYIKGGSLDDEMKLFIKRDIPQPLEYTIKVVTECCEALDYMADLDPPLFHRDIKPHNIIIEPTRGVVLIDFGLAKEVAAGSSKSMSAGGHTAGWSPPERERAVTGPTTDVYSLGQVLWHMLTNEDAGVFSAVRKSEKIVECGHPEWLTDVVNAATIPDNPSKRIGSVAKLRCMLENEGKAP